MFSKMMLSAAACLALANAVQSQFTSFGVDISNGGVYYFNLASTAPFSFQGGFTGQFNLLLTKKSALTTLGAPVVDTVTVSLTLASGSTVSCTSVSTTQTDYESVW
jgi:hypothetical protein